MVSKLLEVKIRKRFDQMYDDIKEAGYEIDEDYPHGNVLDRLEESLLDQLEALMTKFEDMKSFECDICGFTVHYPKNVSLSEATIEHNRISQQKGHEKDRKTIVGENPEKKFDGLPPNWCPEHNAIIPTIGTKAGMAIHRSRVHGVGKS